MTKPNVAIILVVAPIVFVAAPVAFLVGAPLVALAVFALGGMFLVWRLGMKRASGLVNELGRATSALEKQAAARAVVAAFAQVQLPLDQRTENALKAMRETLGLDAAFIVAERPGAIGARPVIGVGVPPGVLKTAETLAAAKWPVGRAARHAMRELHENCSVIPLGTPTRATLAIGSRGEKKVSALVGLDAVASAFSAALEAAGGTVNDAARRTQPLGPINLGGLKGFVRTLPIPMSWGRGKPPSDETGPR